MDNGVVSSLVATSPSHIEVVSSATKMSNDISNNNVDTIENADNGDGNSDETVQEQSQNGDVDGGNNNNNDTNATEAKEEKVPSLYPPEWWWADRQVNDILGTFPATVRK